MYMGLVNHMHELPFLRIVTRPLVISDTKRSSIPLRMVQVSSIKGQHR